MWPLILFALAAVAAVAIVEYLLLPHVLIPAVVDGPPRRQGTYAQFRPGVMPVWVVTMVGVGYLFVAAWEALSPGGDDTGVYVTGLVALVAYEVVAHKLPGRRRLTGLPRFGTEIGFVLGTLLWLGVHW
jgi:hypothetical protein